MIRLENLSASTTVSFATEQADRLLERLAFQIARTIKSSGAAEVHDLRVAIRRLMRVLVVLKPCFPGHESRRIRRRLKKIMVEAGSVRDCDIALGLLTKLAPSKSSPLVRQFQTEREEAAKILIISLKRSVRRNLSAKWRKALKGEGTSEDFRATPVKAAAKRLLPRMASEYFSGGRDAARGKASAEELHRFRIASKNLRYTLDLFAPLYGASINGLTKQLKGVQTLLGEINDCATVARMVSQHRDGSKILAALKKRQRRKAEQFRQHWNTEFSGAAQIRRWTEDLRHVGESSPSGEKTAGSEPARRLSN